MKGFFLIIFCLPFFIGIPAKSQFIRSQVNYDADFFYVYSHFNSNIHLILNLCRDGKDMNKSNISIWEIANITLLRAEKVRVEREINPNNISHSVSAYAKIMSETCPDVW
jgi:hypothetical protein